MLGGQIRGDAGPLDALQRAKLDRRPGDHRPGMAGAHDRVGVAAFHQIDRAAHRGVLLSANRVDRMFVHPDDLSRMDDFDARVAAAVLLKLLLYRGLVARQKELPDFGIFLQRHHRSGDGISRGIIAAHGVEGDPHGETTQRPP